MAISDSKKVDYLWKKLGYGATKTDTNAVKKAPNEAISSPLLLRGDKVWQQADTIPAVGKIEPISKPKTKLAPRKPKITPIHCFQVTFSFNNGPAKAFVSIG